MDKEINVIQFFEEGTKILKDSKPSFNIFEMLGQSSREMTHSAFLAGMLNPLSNHNVGTTFLDLFLQKFGLSNFDAASAEVVIEKDFGNEREDNDGNHFGGRIDIYLEDSKANVIVIENKIYASDQKYQLERYWNSTNRKATIIYLTLDGHQPSEISKGKMEHPILSVSYSDIKNWLNDCLNSGVCSEEVKFAINQYMSNLDNLISEYELEKLITKSRENLRLSMAISNYADTIRQKFRDEFMTWLHQYFISLPHCKSISLPFAEKREVIFTVSYNSIKIDICLDYNVYIRIYKNDFSGHLKGNRWHQYVHKESEFAAWRYLELNGETIDFHNFNTNAYMWIDDVDCFKILLKNSVEELFNELDQK